MLPYNGESNELENENWVYIGGTEKTSDHRHKHKRGILLESAQQRLKV